MSDNSLVDSDANINWDQYAKNGPTSSWTGDVATEGYGKNADEKQSPVGDQRYLPGTGWVNGYSPLDDAYSVMTDGVKVAQDFNALVHGGDWCHPLDLVTLWADEVGLASDVLGYATDPLGSIVGWAVSWVLEHVTVLRFALDGLAGNPDAIAGYATTWSNIADRLKTVNQEFTASVDTGPGEWTGSAHDQYRKMAADVSGALTAAQQIADAMAVLIAAAGQIVNGVRSLIKQAIADCATAVVDGIEALAGDEEGAAGGTLADIGRIAAKASKLFPKLDKFMEDIPKLVPYALTAINAIDKAAQTYAAG